MSRYDTINRYPRSNLRRTNIRRPATRDNQEREPKGPKINDLIRARDVRLIDETGANVGVVATTDALARAAAAGVDLVEISPDANPPVCKIMDYGKFLFEQKKKAGEAKKKQN